MIRLKYIFLYLILASSSVAFSQGMYGNQRLQSQRNHSRSEPNATQNSQRNEFGQRPFFVQYDSDKVIKNIKLRDKAKKIKVGEIFETYNDKIIEIKAFQSGILDQAKLYLKRKQQEFMQSGDRVIMETARIQYKKMVAPLMQTIKTQEDLLNSKLKDQLNDKQYQKWLNYRKDKMRPKNTNNKPQDQDQNQGRGGYNGY
jgi:hypothetical protein